MLDKNGNKIFPIYQLLDLVFDLNYLSGSEKLICIAFLRFYNRRTGKCFPGLTTLSECTGLTRKTLIENIKKLAQKKVIKVKKGNRRKANEYGLLFLGWLDIVPLIEPHTTPLTTPLIEPLATPQPSKVKESKGNKEPPLPPKPKKKKKVFVPPTKEEVIKYFIENEYDGNKGAEAFEFYDCANWFDSRGNKVKNWKQKMRGVWFKDENKVMANNMNGSGQQNTMSTGDQWIQMRRARENANK